MTEKSRLNAEQRAEVAQQLRSLGEEAAARAVERGGSASGGVRVLTPLGFGVRRETRLKS